MTLRNGSLARGDLATQAASPAARTKTLERTVLEEIIDLHPQRITVAELHLRIARDPEDCVEREAVRHAVRELRCDGVIRYSNDDEVIEPTLAASSVFDLLTA